LRIAEFAAKQKFKTCYFISPKLWAWNQKRAKKIKRYVDKMFVILPFEKQFYQKYQYQVTYVGNPLVQTVASFETEPQGLDHLKSESRPIVAILPGSRAQEISHMLEVMLALVPEFSQYKFVLAAVDNVPDEYYHLAKGTKDVAIVTNQAYELLSIASAAIVTSGTASLETALFNVPQIVCYKTSWVTYYAGKLLIKVPFLSLVNLIAEGQVVPELIQREYNRQTVSDHLKSIMVDGPARDQQLAGYRKVKTLLGNKKASQETARLIFDYLTSSKQPSTY
jgi:lipid-A-disaccharide synthase